MKYHNRYHKRWKRSEINKLKTLAESGLAFEAIADQFDGRTAQALRTKYSKLKSANKIAPPPQGGAEGHHYYTKHNQSYQSALV